MPEPQYPPYSVVHLKKRFVLSDALVLKEHLPNGDFYCYGTDDVDTALDHDMGYHGMCFPTITPAMVIRVAPSKG